MFIMNQRMSHSTRCQISEYVVSSVPFLFIGGKLGSLAIQNALSEN